MRGDVSKGVIHRDAVYLKITNVLPGSDWARSRLRPFREEVGTSYTFIKIARQTSKVHCGEHQFLFPHHIHDTLIFIHALYMIGQEFRMNLLLYTFVQRNSLYVCQHKYLVGSEPVFPSVGRSVGRLVCQSLFS